MSSSFNKLFFCIVPVLFVAFGYTQQSVRHETASSKAGHKNPVLNIDFADPTVIHANGMYYAYATQSAHNGKMINIQVASSHDLFNWKYEGDALPQKPAWASHTQDFWAPHALYDSALKKYILFFCAKSNDTTTNMCIGVAFSDKPVGPFTDKGSPLLADKSFRDIDPMAMTDPATGKKILYWGSGFEPIRAAELNTDWASFTDSAHPTEVLYPGKEKNYSNLIEGAWTDVHDGKYYLYYSGDNCCGDKANYAVMIAKADNPFGPFKRLGEANGTGSSVILEKDSVWLAPGHNSVFKDDKGKTWIAYHAIWQDVKKRGTPSGKNHYTKRVMCIEPIQYIHGWPVVLHAY